MPTQSAPAPEGRRARKRRETDNAIALAAIRLALEHGFENVTVDAICDIADVSRSTFFNYYPSRDSAMIGRSSPSYTPELIESAFGNHPGDLVRGAIELLERGAVRAPDPEISRLRAELVATQPAARRHYSYTLIEVQDQLTAAALHWLAAHPEHAAIPDDPEREATLAVTGVYAVLHVVTRGWIVPLALVENRTEQIERTIEELARVAGGAA